MDYQEGKSLADKFFNDRCSPEEAENVLGWLETPDGQKYLDEKISKDFETLDDNNNSLYAFNIYSNKLFSRILNRIEKVGFRRKREVNFFTPFFQIAAGILIVITGSLFYLSDTQSNKSAEGSEVKIFVTGSDEQREIRLGDGTLIQMNRNSELAVSGDYMNRDRTVTLQGEAFFEVAHQPDNAFIIHSGPAEIEVLGTSFNVKLTDTQSKVGVAVSEGKVRLKHTDREKYVILEKGHYGDLNAENGQLLVDKNGIENYLFWKHGRLVFDSMGMDEICLQLERIYGTKCVYDNSSVKNRTLTANFLSENLEKTLSVIGLSLGLEYEKKDEIIHWYSNE